MILLYLFPKNEYSSKFGIKGGSCILNDKTNTSLTNDYETTENELENTKVDWKIATLISFGSSKNLLMNGFISWYMWIKEVFNTNCVMTYNTLSNLQRSKKMISLISYMMINFLNCRSKAFILNQEIFSLDKKWAKTR